MFLVIFNELNCHVTQTLVQQVAAEYTGFLGMISIY